MVSTFVVAFSLGAMCLHRALSLRAGLNSHWSPELNPVEAHGKLSVRGGKLVDQAGKPVRLRGMSLYSSQWGGGFYNAATVRWLAEDWHASVVRAAMAAEGGYLVDPATEMTKVETVVNAAVAAGIYVIIEWHDRHAGANLEVARAFFQEMALKYGGFANVLFEPCGQPDQTPWPEMKQYNEAVIEVIRQHTDNLIIVGAPHWGQGVDVASANPVAGDNLAYAFHFNAAVHGKGFREKVLAALRRGVPVFCSEWTTGNKTQKGTVSLQGSQAWVDFMAANSISDVNWAIYDGKDVASALQAPAASDGWPASALTASGGWARASLRGERPPPPPCELCSAPGENCLASRCCSAPHMQCYEKDAYFAACRPACAPGVDPSDAPRYQTSWTCRALGGACARSCTAAGGNCRDSGCCKGKDLTCFEKDEYFSGCRATCEPGLDTMDAPQYRTPWSCRTSSTT